MTDIFRTLTRHFIRRLSASGDGASESTLVRSLAVVAVPMLMAAFWIVTLAHNVPPWAMAEIHYLFVLYSFCAMGCVTALQWERLFPDRTDFLILLPLPLRPRTMFAAKLLSVAAVQGMFLAAANVFGTMLFPLLSGREMPRVMLAHAVAVLATGIASTLAVLVLESLLVVLVPERWYRRTAPVVQALLVTGFVLILLRMATASQHLSLLFRGDLPAAGWFPPLWFLAMYETALGGTTSTDFAHVLTHRGWASLPVLLGMVALLYPLAWVRRRRMALEGTRGARIADSPLWQWLLHPMLLRDADQRAIFHFVRKTLARLSRYHVLLAVYSGAGMALCLTFAIRLDFAPDGPHWSASDSGTRMVLPILLFWTVAGLRVAFLLPDELAARWIFRMSPLDTRRVIRTVKGLVFAVCMGVIAAVAVMLAACRWSAQDVVRQSFYGCLLAVVLTDVFFFLEASIPFTRPRLPERGSLPLTLAIYLFGLPLCILLMLTLEHWTGDSWLRLVLTGISAAAVHAAFHVLRYLPSHVVSTDPFLGEKDEEVQTLGLNT